jgi:hypothetical protein
MLVSGCAWMAAGAVGARLCASTCRRASPLSPAAQAAAGDPPSICGHDLLRCASFFLLARTGRSPDGSELSSDAQLSSVLAADVQAYGVTGRRQVLDAVKASTGSFHTDVLSIAASTIDASVRVHYHDGSEETIRCTRGADQQVLIRQLSTAAVLTDRAHSCSATAVVGSARDVSGSVGVEVLWWAIRFLHADISRDYALQRRYLAPNATAFGAEGRERVLSANGEGLPEEEKTGYTVPYPITVDIDNGARLSAVSSALSL